MTIKMLIPVNIIKLNTNIIKNPLVKIVSRSISEISSLCNNLTLFNVFPKLVAITIAIPYKTISKAN